MTQEINKHYKIKYLKFLICRYNCIDISALVCPRNLLPTFSNNQEQIFRQAQVTN